MRKVRKRNKESLSRLCHFVGDFLFFPTCSGPREAPAIAGGASDTYSYEGTSHDVDENKGRENRLLEHPTMLMKTKGLILVIPRC